MEPKPASPVEEPKTISQIAGANRPISDVVPVSTTVANAKSDATSSNAKDAKNPKQDTKQAITPKKSGQSVTAAIAATVLIVFGLAALAVFAFLSQNK